jgi:hypothetical protein
VKSKIDFIDIIENKLGIKTDEDYDRWAKEIQARGITQEDIDLLDPDKIDSKAFWKYITHKFNHGICGTGGGNKQWTESQIEINFKLYQSKGVTGFIAFLSGIGYKNIAELGVGFGSLLEWCKATKLNYIGFDVAVQKGVEAIEIEDGVIPVEKFGERKPDVFVCFNVMQHMSKKQRENYLRQIYDIMPDHAYFIVSMLDGHTIKYTFTYGQVIPMPTTQEFYEELYNQNFYAVQTNKRFIDGMTTIFCRKQPTTGV